MKLYRWLLRSSQKIGITGMDKLKGHRLRGRSASCNYSCEHKSFYCNRPVIRFARLIFFFWDSSKTSIVSYHTSRYHNVRQWVDYTSVNHTAWPVNSMFYPLFQLHMVDIWKSSPYWALDLHIYPCQFPSKSFKWFGHESVHRETGGWVDILIFVFIIWLWILFIL